MNRCVPDWNMEGDHGPFCDFLPTASQRKSEWPDHELMELLWQNGHVVMHSQAQRRVPPVLNELRDAQKTEKPLKCGGSSEDPNNSVQEDETMPWFQFPLDDSLDKDFCFDFFYGMPTSDSIDSDKPSQDVIAGKCLKFGSTKESNVFRESVSKQSSNLLLEESTMTPPDTQVTGSITHASGPDCGFINFSHFSRPENTNLGTLNGKLVGEKWLGNQSEGETGESSSMITKGSSHCGSNQFQNQVNLSHTWSNGMTDIFSKGSKDDKAKFVYGRRQTEAHETVVTSSSGGSGCSFGRIGQQIASNQGHKRKGRDAEEYECQSEETGYESVANKQVQRSASARKNRAAEVHNLSERRRRDRINEKMKALQELIPYCNKSDKASMLDEAIEYLKSLQLQVQMMWMGSGMAPMMFSGVQQYLSRMGMGIGHSSMPSFHSHVQFPRVPLVNQSMPSAHAANQLLINPSPVINPTNFQNQIQNAHLPGSYAPYLGFHHMQPEVQGMNLCMYGSQLGNQIQTSVPASNSSPPNDGGSPSKTIQNDESDNKLAFQRVCHQGAASLYIV